MRWILMLGVMMLAANSWASEGHDGKKASPTGDKASHASSKAHLNLILSGTRERMRENKARQLSEDELLEHFREIVAQADKREAAYEEGKAAIEFCQRCHGETGQSKRGYIPNLAAQHPEYLFKQFRHFATGERKSMIMEPLARRIDPHDAVHVAIYYAMQKPVANVPSDLKRAQAGEPLFKSRCASCHGDMGQGNADHPRLAGQPEQYLNEVLRTFKYRPEKRSGTVMSGIAQSLSDEDIRNVAAYLTGLASESKVAGLD
ncbi:MAG: cytochrome biogenesis protein ResB [Gammaproteobacteria bacterium]|nr:MAG: cytochrome biogenesis protein ResB [Gammaproteobacteria bacterium]